MHIPNLHFINICIIFVFFPLSTTTFQNYCFTNFLSSSVANNLEVDEDRVFWAYNYVKQEYYQVNSRLLAIGDYCYIYMAEECIISLGEASVMAKVETLCNEFDNVIYSCVIDLAGHPNGTMGDIDGDPKIFILFLDSYNYYSEANDIEHNISNCCEMFYINYRLFHHQWLFPTMAHEFHHLIWFNNEWDEPPFTLEALAQYATYHAGYLDPYNNLVPQVLSYLPHPENSPLYWNNDEDYGSTYLFAFYIAEKYGVQVLRDLIYESSDGPQGIEKVLLLAGYNVTFNELFMNWITALVLDQLGFSDNMFGFEGFDTQITRYELVNQFPFTSKPLSISHYAFNIHKIASPPNNFIVKIDKSPQDAIGISLAVHDIYGWHVNQNLYYGEIVTINDTFLGSFIDEGYIITSYLSHDTPIAPKERGVGPSIEIVLSIVEGGSNVKNESVSNQSSSKTSKTTMTYTSPFPNILFLILLLNIAFLFFHLIRKNNFE